jgi:5'-3' exoribonuclease 2
LQIKVLISDASVPGEGEHKIMDFIRSQRAQPNYNPNTKHCICGMDADLIMLTLATHEPHFSIIRETLQDAAPRKCFICNRFGHLASECEGFDLLSFSLLSGLPKEMEGEFDEKAPKELKPQQFLMIDVLREYLDLFFDDVKSSLPIKYDLERCIDDFVFLCYFGGNDFLPHLPTLHIQEGAIDLLMGVYKTLLPTLGYLTDSGEIDYKKVAIYLSELGKMEDGILLARFQREEAAKEKRRQAKKRQRERRKERERQLAQGEVLDAANMSYARALKEKLQGGIEPVSKRPKIEPGKSEKSGTQLVEPTIVQVAETKTEQVEEEEEDEEKDDDPIRLGTEGWKERYYLQKFGVDISDTENIKK